MLKHMTKAFKVEKLEPFDLAPVDKTYEELKF